MTPMDKLLDELELADRRIRELKAALARVLALCDLVETYDHPVAWHTEIRAAIEGE